MRKSRIPFRFDIYVKEMPLWNYFGATGGSGASTFWTNKGGGGGGVGNIIWTGTTTTTNESWSAYTGTSWTYTTDSSSTYTTSTPVYSYATAIKPTVSLNYTIINPTDKVKTEYFDINFFYDNLFRNHLGYRKWEPL